jgi:hypothetical protein
MTNFRSYALPFAVAIPLAAGAGLFWESRGLLPIAAMIGVQALLPAAPATTPVQQVSRHG